MKLMGLNITRASVENPSVPLSDPAAWQALFGELPTTAGVSVNENTALNYSTVWACVSLIAGTLAQLPLVVRRRTGENTSEPAKDHPIYPLIAQTPNPDSGMTSADWRETMQTKVLLQGNGVSFISARRGAGRPPARIVPLTSVEILRKDNKLGYKVVQSDGKTKIYRPAEVIHIRGLSPDGMIGHSVIANARNSIGLGVAAESYGARLFANDARPNVILNHPAKLSPEAVNNIKAAWVAAHGAERRFTPAVMQEGMTAQEIGFPPEDSQFLETRRFQVADVCRFFGVPPFMVGDTERSTSWGTGIEQQTLGFINFVLARWIVRWELELNNKLFPGDEEHFVKFNMNALLRGDFKTRTDGYQSGILSGWLTRNEVRALEDMNPLEGLDDPLAPLNMGNTGDNVDVTIGEDNE